MANGEWRRTILNAHAKRTYWKYYGRLAVVFVLVLAVCTESLPTQAFVLPSSGDQFSRLGAHAAQWGYQAPEPYYAERLLEYEAQGYQPAPDVWIDLAGTGYSGQYEADLEELTNIGGRAEPVLAWWEAGGEAWVEWTFDVPTAGLYNLGLEYYPLEGKRASIQRSLQIDGEYPFIEARRVAFDRTWEDAHPPVRDNQGHDIRPSQREAPRWRFQIIEDGQAMYREPYLFYLEPGPHTVRLGMIREPMAIARLSLFTPPDVPAYQAVRARYEEAGYQATKGILVKIEGEEAQYKSTPTLTRNYSPDPSAYPPAEGSFRLNVFGGWRWRRPAERASWRFSVPQDGLYKIGVKLWHGDWTHMPVFRAVTIDGEYPFDEMREVGFPYNWNWQLRTIGDPRTGEPYLIYLKAGEHTLEMRSVVGPPISRRCARCRTAVRRCPSASCPRRCGSSRTGPRADEGHGESNDPDGLLGLTRRCDLQRFDAVRRHQYFY